MGAGSFNRKFNQFVEFALVACGLIGGIAMTCVLLWSGYARTPKLIGFTAALYGLFVFCLIRRIRYRDSWNRRRVRESRASEKLGTMDIPPTKIQPPLHRVKRDRRG